VRFGLDQYNKIKNGMTYVEVADKIGCKGKELSRFEIFNIGTVLVMWPGNGRHLTMALGCN
jgi:hypothetical protein